MKGRRVVVNVSWGCVCLNVILSGCQPSAINQQVDTDKAFKTVAHLNSPRYGCAATIIDDNIYILGGSDVGGLLREVERYNVLDNKVTEVTDKLIPRRYHTVESYDGKIYVIGGVHRLRSNAPLEEINNVECYDPETNKVKILSPLPTARKMPASAVHDGKIYVIGGSATRPKVNGREFYYTTVEIYDIKTDMWHKGSDMPTPRQCDVVLKDGKIYAIGGYRGVSLNDFEVYDIEMDQWKKLPDIPFTISAHHAVVLGNKVYCFGDYYDTGRVSEYDFTTGRWNILFTNYRPSRHNAVVGFGNAIYVVGGTTTTQGYPMREIQRFRPLSLY